MLISTSVAETRTNQDWQHDLNASGEVQEAAIDIFAAGDVANFFHPALEKRTRVEHEEFAIQMGKLAVRNMAGAHEIYSHVPMFYSDLFELGFEAVGELNSQMTSRQAFL